MSSRLRTQEGCRVLYTPSRSSSTPAMNPCYLGPCVEVKATEVALEHALRQPEALRHHLATRPRGGTPGHTVTRRTIDGGEVRTMLVGSETPRNTWLRALNFLISRFHRGANEHCCLISYDFKSRHHNNNIFELLSGSKILEIDNFAKTCKRRKRSLLACFVSLSHVRSKA